ncbi:putative uncharacterized protein DDB_G0286751 [Panonychus citri]|uniref:putative uncharacterized protein DDB_G0286751 n=1 Tax=Panonychus citri TaxID=50023 RepID=UPI00230825FE|nr:putative uncharacterized protein DDB_G0286751 [Panonychus citri]
MAESDRPSSSSSSGDRYHGGGKRIPLKQSRSVDAASCMFEMEGLDFDDDEDRLDSSGNNNYPIKSFANNRKSDSNEGGRRRRIGVTSIDRDDEDFNNNTNDSNDENNDDNGEESNINKRNNNNSRNRRIQNKRNADDDFTDEDNDDNEDEDDDDDNDDDDDDSDTRNMFQRMNLNSKCTRQFATSLPIQVPLWKTSPLNQETDDTDTEQNITCDEDPRKIAESFRALAWSVKDGTTEMFGALPRHRLKSRPI